VGGLGQTTSSFQELGGGCPWLRGALGKENPGLTLECLGSGPAGGKDW
jgi:hypothetical protein